MLGIDISNWQSVDSVDIAPDFVIIKATQGTGYVSPTCDLQYQRAISQGKLVGVYHYASGGDPIAEANFFIDNCEGYIGQAILALDWEEYQNPRYYEFASWCKVFLDHCYARTGVRPLIYMNASCANSADWSSIASDYGLWLAGYPDTRDSWNVPDFPYSIPYWECVAIWQYTNSNGQLDRDEAYMDRNAWALYAKPNNNSSPVASSKPVEQPITEPEHNEPIELPKTQPVVADELISPVDVVPARKTLTSKEYLEFIEKTKESVELVENTAKKYGVKITMSNKVYDVLKVVVTVILPVISALYIGLANIWGFGFGEEVDKTIQLIIVAINAVLGLAVVKSSKDYKKGNE